MRQGTVIKAYSGFYYVDVANEIWECRLRGKFRLTKQTVLAGDRVRVQETQHKAVGADKKSGVIEEIMPRSTVLDRPAVANVDQVVIVFACQDPDPQTELLDRLLVMAEAAYLKAVICFNKVDLVDRQAADSLMEDYRRAGYETLATSTKQRDGIEDLHQKLRERITVFAGPSGAGKSSLLNTVYPGFRLKTGAVSEKIGRGRHTTRFAELMEPEPGTMVVDSPGFSAMDLPELEKQHLGEMFPEFLPFIDGCRFNGCLHKSEPDCKVKEALARGEIGQDRYDHYLLFLDEVSTRERRY